MKILKCPGNFILCSDMVSEYKNDLVFILKVLLSHHICSLILRLSIEVACSHSFVWGLVLEIFLLLNISANQSVFSPIHEIPDGEKKTTT